MKTNWKNTLNKIAGMLALAVILTACDTSSSLSGDDATDGATFSQTVSFLAADMGLSSTETAALSASFAKFGDGSVDGDKEPGFLWRVAADLQATLTDEQKARLYERLEQIRDGERGGQDQGMRPGQNGQGQNGQRRPGMGGPGMGGPGGQGEGPGGGFAQLDLTDDQQAAIDAIRESYKDDIEAIVAQRETLSRDEIKEQLDALHEAIRAEVEAVLTAEQIQQLEDLKAEAEARRAEREAEMEANREEAKLVMIEVLGLTADQVAALDALQAARETDREAIKALRDAGASEEEIQAAMEAGRAAHEAELDAILDDTQLEITMIYQVLSFRMRNQGGPGGQGGPSGQGGQNGFRGQGGPGGQGGLGGPGGQGGPRRG